MKSVREGIFPLALFLIAFASVVLAQGTYTQIDYPGSPETYAFGINSAGDIVGFYSANFAYHGFVLRGGVYTSFDFPGTHSTYFFGINDVGQIVGNTVRAGGTGSVGFLYKEQTQTFTKIRSAPGAIFTTPFSINNAGTIAGELQMDDGTSNSIGFELVNGSYKRIIPLGATSSSANGINNAGEIIGNALSGADRGINFLFNQGHFQQAGVPNDIAYATGINDSVAIVGFSYGHTCCRGFLYQNGTFQFLSFPGSPDTEARAVNDSDEVVGYFGGADGHTHGFLWTPSADTSMK